MASPRLDAFGIVVADMARSLGFYRALGLEIPATADAEPHAEATLAGGVRLMFDGIDTVRSFLPSWEPPTGGHRMGLAFRCESPADVDATYAAITGLGHKGRKEPWDAFWGQRYAIVIDPDGNPVDLYAPLPDQD
ncbi:MAG: VOC family protein [Acidimicrobiales bacterium]